MRNIICFLLFAAILVNFPVFAASEAKPEHIPLVFEQYISVLNSSTTYRPLQPIPAIPATVPLTISKIEAQEDVVTLRYLFETGYSGKDYWQRHGVNFPGMFAELEQYASSSNRVSVIGIEDIVSKYLALVCDGHLSMKGLKSYRFFKHQNAWFADVLLEHQGNSFCVIYSIVPELPVGSLVQVDKKNLFPTLSPTGKQHFLVGVLSAEVPANVPISTAKVGIVKLPLHSCRLDAFDFVDSPIFSCEAVEGIPILRVSSFAMKYDTDLSKFLNSALTIKEKPVIILNILGNHGGSEEYPSTWLQNLNGYFRNSFSRAELYSPPIIESYAILDLKTAPLPMVDNIKWTREYLPKMKTTPKVFWTYGCYSESQQVGTYPGKLFVLANRNTGSAGDMTVAFSRGVKNCFVVGENTAGIGVFANVHHYILPNSKIQFNLPSQLVVEPSFQEGQGYMPDFWLDTREPIPELIRWASSPDDYQFRNSADRR
ncbi:MAG: S41 family peptidase [Candidatus Ozemobacteraceae bacterium]